MHNVPEADKKEDIQRNRNHCSNNFVAHAFYDIYLEEDVDLGMMAGCGTSVQKGVRAELGFPCKTLTELLTSWKMM